MGRIANNGGTIYSIFEIHPYCTMPKTIALLTLTGLTVGGWERWDLRTMGYGWLCPRISGCHHQTAKSPKYQT
jgi:hypothetical protein